MHRHQISRRTVISIIFILIFILSLSRFYNERLPGLNNESHMTHIQHEACCIWPGWKSSDRGNLRYDAYSTNDAQVLSVGEAKVLGDPEVCLNAESRLSAYRMASKTDHDWNTVHWGRVQKRCAAAHEHLYTNELDAGSTRTHDTWTQSFFPTETDFEESRGGKRTAVVLRTWDDYDYTDARRTWLRTLITETALHSAGHYEVFLLVNVKDDTIQLEEDEAAYEQTLQAHVPNEFSDMALLWNQRTVEKWYPKIEEHGAQDQMYQALQIFSHQFPNFGYVWQLEMDARFTGHIYDTLENAVTFARLQPRRNLWERNGRFFIPGLHNGSYDSFTKAVDDEIGDTGVWGPAATTNFTPKGPEPPPRSEKHWGVDEDADLVTLFPNIDPVGSDWIYESMVHGFADGLATPRRAGFVSMTRSSRRLLYLVSKAQRESGQWLASEATLETFALLHGLKAVSIPHQITFANDWTVQQLSENINRGPSSNKAGGSKISASYTTQGWISGPWEESSYWFTQNDADNNWRTYVDGKCMPPLILHPIKDE